MVILLAIAFRKVSCQRNKQLVDIEFFCVNSHAFNSHLEYGICYILAQDCEQSSSFRASLGQLSVRILRTACLA